MPVQRWVLLQLPYSCMNGRYLFVWHRSLLQHQRLLGCTPGYYGCSCEAGYYAKSPYTCLGGVCGYYRTATGGTSGCPIRSWGCPCDAYGYCATPLNCVERDCSTIAVGGSSGIGGGSACAIRHLGLSLCLERRLLQSVHLLQRLLLRICPPRGFSGLRWFRLRTRRFAQVLGGYSTIVFTSVSRGGTRSREHGRVSRMLLRDSASQPV